MEWVEVAGKTVQEATEQALDQLGVGPGDAEVIVVTEPKMGLFGRVRVEARVRARVRPVGARPKRERSRRGGSRSGQGGGQQRSGSSGSRSGGRAVNGGGSSGSRSSAATATATGGANSAGADNDAGDNGSQSGRSGDNGSAGTGTGTSRSARRRRNRSKATAGGGAATGDRSLEGSRNGSTKEPSGRAPRGGNEPKETVDMAEGMTLEEQGEIGRAFLVGLLAEYGVDADGREPPAR